MVAALRKPDTKLAEVPAKLVAKPPPRRLVSKRTTALFLLILQNASVSLLTRLSRTPGAGTAIYAPSVAVFVAELMKLMASLTMLARERQAAGKEKEGRTSLVGHARRAVVDLLTNQRGEIIKLAVPAALYAVQNTLLYVALSHLSASVYQTTYQLKLLTAALFSVIIFKRALSRTQWASLLLLTLGVATVQLDGVRHPPPSDSSGQDQRIGLLAILAACISSGLAGGWFEHVLKSPSARAPPTPSTSPIKPSFQPPTPSSPLRLRHNSPSLWARNLQLSVPSLAFSLAGVFLSPEWSRVRKHGPLQGFTPLVWSVVLNQALGGLLVAMVVRYADSVAKGFATSIAIVLSTLASVIFFGLVPGPLFLLGASLVIASTILYTMDMD